MATPQLSPGVLIREVDLTVGRAENVLDNLGAIAGPFSIGPINEPIEISNEQQFINTFGTPLSTDKMMILDGCRSIPLLWWHPKGCSSRWWCSQQR